MSGSVSNTVLLSSLLGVGLGYQNGKIVSTVTSPTTFPITTAAMVAWFVTLPTDIPSTPGQPWNNGGVLSVS